MDANFTFDLTKKETELELASYQDADLMKVRCYATHEGKNLNGTIFLREILMSSYRTFIDRPVVIVPDKFSNPTTHGYDYKKKVFMNNKRVNVGHITDAFPVMVSPDGTTFERIFELEDLTRPEFDGYELRIIADLVIYKHYLYDIAERLKLLHELGDLNFSMEAVHDAIVNDDGTKISTNICFTGLAIVDKPAFVKAKSIEVAGQKEDGDCMEFKEMYEAEVQKNAELAQQIETFKSDNNSLKAQVEEAKSEVAEVKEQLANSKVETANALAEVEELKPFKEKVELAEKEALGKERATKLEKFGVKELDVNELAEMSNEAFADKLVEAADKFTIEVAENKPEVKGVPKFDEGMKSNMDKLLSLLG